MNQRVYNVKDIESLRFFPEIDCVKTEENERGKREGKRIIRNNFRLLGDFVREASIKKMDLGYVKRRDMSVKLPHISREQGTAVRFGELRNSGINLGVSGKGKQIELLGRAAFRGVKKSIDFGILVAKGLQKSK